MDFFRLFCETETTKTREWNQRFRSCCRLEGLLQLPQLLFSFTHSLLLRQCTRTVIYAAGQTRVFPLHLLNSAAGVNVTISLRLWQDVVSQLLKQSHHKCGWALLCWLISEIVKHVVWVGLSKLLVCFIATAVFIWQKRDVSLCLTVPPHGPLSSLVHGSSSLCLSICAYSTVQMSLPGVLQSFLASDHRDSFGGILEKSWQQQMYTNFYSVITWVFVVL